MGSPVYITAMADALPNQPVSNKEMENLLGMAGNKPSRARAVILRSNKIKQRYYAIDPETKEMTHTNASLAAQAIKGLFTDPTELNQIQSLIASTSQADQTLPNHGVMVHGELNNPPCEVVSTSGICLCGVTALKYAYLNIKAEEVENSVVVASEIASSMMTAKNFDKECQHKVETLEQNPEVAFEKDFLRWMLSDGAGAAFLQNKPVAGQLNLRIDWIDIISYANELETCMYAGAVKQDDGQLKSWTRFSAEEVTQQSIMTVKQDVRLLNENIVKYTVEDALSRIIEKRKLVASDYALFVPHYSSGYFRERLYAGLENIDFTIPYEKWYTNLTERGNTGSASIFIMLSELLRSNTLEKGQQLLCYIPESGRFSSGFMQLTVE
ncbi:beta-ketoacyl-ACP synthase III [Pseudoalteromonas sp. MMG024]|uniref:beta-ketoacyl-ACP synthase III n=1 Tax=Pseudoalteromonas sp. MMG024 TaxID=2909980 RepID=UPI001F37E89D|nr:beta-ketoacyl-ACP synthase III [Pseudoalteromonas sp. MMG024]MCF6456923.1 beta-ketoacyl-ACP synthase III [Pseudoalteromonas sp. MMG024]